MLKKIFFTSFLFLLLTNLSFSQSTVRVVTFNEFKDYMNRDDGVIYVINFWATWCKPCVQEMPYFEKLNNKYKDQNVHVLLVSLDLVNNLDKKVTPFIKKNKIKSEVILLNDTRYNRWINQVHPKWTGAIPFTLVYKGNAVDYFEGPINYLQLEDMVKPKL